MIGKALPGFLGNTTYFNIGRINQARTASERFYTIFAQLFRNT